MFLNQIQDDNFHYFSLFKMKLFIIFFFSQYELSQNCLWKRLKLLLQFSACLLYCSTNICGHLRCSRGWEPFLNYVTWCKMMTNLSIEAKSKQLNCFYEFVLNKLFYTLDFFLLPSFYFPIYYCSILSNILHNPCGGQSWDSLC